MAPAGPAANALLRERDKIERATDVIDRDPQEALAKIEPLVHAAPNVGEITQADMFRLMSQMQAQMAGMQTQIIELMTGDRGNKARGPDTAAELRQDKLQRDLTLKAWAEDPREPVFVHPDQDEEQIHKITNDYPPRVFRINGLEFPVQVGQIVNVPSSVARLIEFTQHRRPYSGPPQNLNQISDPQRAQFLAAAQSISIGNPGHAGEGRVIPDGLPPPQPLGIRYDHNGQ